jgi:hypothetical protein
VQMKLEAFFSVLLLICRVFFSCCSSAAWSQATVWAPTWEPRSRTCDRSYLQRLHRFKDTSPRVLPCLCAREVRDIYSVPLLI